MSTKLIAGVFAVPLLVAALGLSGCASSDMKSMDSMDKSMMRDSMDKPKMNDSEKDMMKEDMHKDMDNAM